MRQLPGFEAIEHQEFDGDLSPPLPPTEEEFYDTSLPLHPTAGEVKLNAGLSNKEAQDILDKYGILMPSDYLKENINTSIEAGQFAGRELVNLESKLRNTAIFDIIDDDITARALRPNPKPLTQKSN